MRNEALSELYAKRPEAKAQIARAPGYAVFSNIGSKIFMVATGNGFGVATDNRTKKNTYMKMVEAGGGFGIGIKTYRAVYVFTAVRPSTNSSPATGRSVERRRRRRVRMQERAPAPP
jgi:hypothetical protein